MASFNTKQFAWIDVNVVLLGVYCLCREEDQVGAQYRAMAARLLNRMCNDEKEGPKVMLELRRFMLRYEQQYSDASGAIPLTWQPYFVVARWRP